MLKNMRGRVREFDLFDCSVRGPEVTVFNAFVKKIWLYPYQYPHM